jgi:hypothetical protein
MSEHGRDIDLELSQEFDIGNVCKIILIFLLRYFFLKATL